MKKKIALSALSILLILSTVGGVFAYFTVNREIQKNLTVASTDAQGRIEITTFDQLLRYATAETYNDASEISNPLARHTLVLKNDVELAADLFVTADCHLDLAGFKLRLMGHTLTFVHKYRGSTVISADGVQGGIDLSDPDDPNGSGKIIFDIPNSAPIFDKVKYFKGTSEVTEADAITVLNADPQYTAYNALYTVASRWVNFTDKPRQRLTYDEVKALTALDFSCILTPRHNCTAGTADELCVFADRDMEFPDCYLSDNVRITYESSNPSVLSNFGTVNPAGVSTVTTVTLRVSVTVLPADGTPPTDAAATTAATTASSSASSAPTPPAPTPVPPTAVAELTVHIYNPSDDATLLSIMKTFLLDELQGYYQADQQKYIFNHGVYLPTVFTGMGTAAYNAYTGTAGETLIPYADVFTKTSEDTVNFESNSTCTYLEVSLTSGQKNEVLRLPMKSGNSALIATNASIAQDLVTAWYGGSIKITPIYVQGSTTEINGYNPVALRGHVPELNTKYHITAVEYELMNNTNQVYELARVGQDDFVRVQKGKHPGDFVGGVMLNCKFTFDDGTETSLEQIQVSIIYEENAGGDNANEFLPYYTYYNEMLYANLAGATYSDFSMPFCYGNVGPIICYDIMQKTAEGAEPTLSRPPFMQIALYYNKAEQFVFSYAEGTSLTAALDQYLTSNNITLDTVIGAGDAKWVFKLAQDRIPTSNTEIFLAYNYKMTSSIEKWTVYLDSDNKVVTSRLMISGVLHNDAEDIPDSRLYRWIYENYNITSEPYTAGKLIVTDWLKQNISIDITNGNTRNFPTDADLNFKGIEYLVGCKILNLTAHPSLMNAANADPCAIYISEMLNLEELYLSQNAFRDRVDAVSPDLGTVSRFVNLKKLRILDLSSNNIFSFEWLVNIPSLEKVYVYGNLEIIGDTKYPIANIFYGCTGIVNFTSFEELMGRGVLLYNTKPAEVPLLFEEMGAITDYTRLRSLEYQKKLKAGVDISEIYKDFSTDPTDYQLTTTHPNAEKGQYTHSITFSPVGADATAATAFKLVDSILVNGKITVIIELEFHIIRI